MVNIQLPMDFEKLKNLVNKLGGLLVLDNDKPVFIMLTYDKYQETKSSKEVLNANANDYFDGGAVNIENDEKTVEKLNQEILALKEEIKQKEEAELVTEDNQFDGPATEAVDSVSFVD